MRRLVKNVKVGNDWYGPAYGNATNVPDDVAEQVTNPAAWEEVEEQPKRRTRKNTDASGEG